MHSNTDAHPVNAWLWRIAIARHSPPDPTMRGVLWALATFLDSDGEGWATQTQIAAAAATSRRTVIRSLDKASKAHWLGMKPRGVPGRQWKLYEYRACVPAELDFDNDEFEKLADATAKVRDPVDATWLRGSHYKVRRDTESRHKGKRGRQDVTLVQGRCDSDDTHDVTLVHERRDRGLHTVPSSASSSVPHWLVGPPDPPPQGSGRPDYPSSQKEKSEIRAAAIRKHLSQGMTPEEVYKAAAGAIPLADIQAIAAIKEAS